MVRWSASTNRSLGEYTSPAPTLLIPAGLLVEHHYFPVFWNEKPEVQFGGRLEVPVRATPNEPGHLQNVAQRLGGDLEVPERLANRL